MNSNWSYGPEKAKWGHDLCDLDLWPRPFASTSLVSLVINPENFMMIRWWEHTQQGKSEGFDSCDRPSNLTQIDSNHQFFSPCDLEIWRMTFNKANLRDLIAATGLVILLKFDPNHRFFSLCDLEIWWMNMKNNRAPLPYYIKLCASANSNQSYSQETLNSGQNRQFFVPSPVWNLTDDLQKQ